MKKVFFIVVLVLIFSLAIHGEFKNKEEAYINANNVNIRSGPSTKHGSKGFLKIGTSITILKRSDKKVTIGKKTDYWYLCQYEPGEGWVFGSLISRGKFDQSNFVKKLPKPKVLSKYNVLKANPWNNCNKQEAEDGGMGCYDIIFGEKTVKTTFPPENEYFQILQVKSNAKNSFIFKVKLIMSNSIIMADYENSLFNLKGRRKLYTFVVKYNPKENTITINKDKYYKLR